MSRYILNWKIGGEAGFGIKSAGLVFARVVNRAGYEAFGYVEYPSLIRGGHNSYQITVADVPVRSAASATDILVALNAETIENHSHELAHGAAVLYDKNTTSVRGHKFLADRNVHFLHVPFKELTDKAAGPIVMRNTVALGATQALLGLPFNLLASVIKKTLGHKARVLEANITAARLGFDYVHKQYANLHFKIKLPIKKAAEELLLTGNDAISLGALAAGLQFYAAYPMTPSSGILHYLASKASSERLVVKHAEDEISVINMALGASHVGARAMIGTSGGGFSLMVEALGLAGITETPLVIVEAQRPGPATGLPTWTEQADLRFVLHAAQGEFPRIVLAPGDHEECFYMTAQAFNLADKYQLPVLILTDKFLGESDRTVAPFDEKQVHINRAKAVLSDALVARTKDFKRYRLSDGGVSGRSIPGQKNGIYIANSDEHDEYGFSTEGKTMRVAQVDKRMKKLEIAAHELGVINLYGNPGAKTTIVSWGSTKGPILDALAWLSPWQRRKVNFLHLNVMWPFPTRAVTSILKRSKRRLLIENNATGQLGGLIRQMTGVTMTHEMLKYDGRPFYAAEVKQRIMSL